MNDVYHNNYSKVILDICDNLKDNIDLLEFIMETRGQNNISGLKERFPGLRNGDKKIKVLLTGEFSSGKTTFIGRLLGIGESAGSISPFPETSTIIEHIGGYKSFKIKFKKNFSFDNELQEIFTTFIKDYGIRNSFHQNGNEWECQKDDLEFTFQDWSNQKCLSFMEGLNKVCLVVDTITWSHAIKKSETSIFKSVSILDTPGIGGSDVHNEVINNLIPNIKPDVIIYFVDTDKGLPTADGFTQIGNWLATHITNAPKFIPSFYWVYQKSSNTMEKNNNFDDCFKDNQWLEETNLKIKELLSKNTLLEGLNEVSRIKVLKYLEERSKIIDARGDRTNFKKATNAMSEIIGHYFINCVESYIQQNLKSLEALSDFPTILKQNDNNPLNPTRVIVDFMKKYIKDNVKIEKSILKEKLKKLLSIDVWENLPNIEDINISKIFKEHLNQFIDILIQIIEKSNRNSSVFDPIKKIVKKEAEFDCDLNYFLKEDFERDLLKTRRSDWGKNIFLAQALVLSYAYHSKQLAGFYTKDIEDRILEIMNKDIKKLKEILTT